MNRESKRHKQREEQRTERATGTLPPTDLPEKRRTPPGQYMREVRGELKKVNWPNRREVLNYSVVVLVTTLALTLLTWGLDWLFSNAVINLFT